MAYDLITMTAAFPGSASYTASGVTDILISAPLGTEIFWVVNATQPAEDPGLFNRLTGGETVAMTLEDGESLWLAAPSNVGAKVCVSY